MEHQKSDTGQDSQQDLQQVEQERMAELERMAERMAAALVQLQCGHHCGPVYEFIEVGATLHQEELEWACVVHVAKRYVLKRRQN